MKTGVGMASLRENALMADGLANSHVGVIPRDISVLGAGFAGISMMYMLSEFGLTARRLESGPSVGGVSVYGGDRDHRLDRSTRLRRVRALVTSGPRGQQL